MKKILLLSLFLVIAYGQGKFSGVTYFDYSYDLTNDSTTNNAFGLNRVYFTYEQKLSDNISYKFQTDIDIDIGKIYGSSPFNVYLKNAKVDWKTSIGKITLGMQGMNIFNVTEKNWGFRFLEKSPMDKHKFSSSADMGIGYSNIFGSYNFNFMITNGTGYKKSENDKYKKLSAQIIFGPKNLTKKDGVNIGTSLSIEPYDFSEKKWSITNDETEEGEWAETGNVSVKNKTVLSIYSGYAGNKLRIGAEFDMHKGTYDTPTPTSNISEPIMESEIMTKSIIATYASYKLSDTFEVLAYIDLYDPWTESIDNIDTNDINEARDSETNIIAGFSYHPGKGLTITPNVRMSIPEEGNTIMQFMMNFEFKF